MAHFSHQSAFRKKAYAVSGRRRYIALLEVLIAFAIIVLCALPLVYSQTMIIKAEKQFLDSVELDHAANLIYASLLENLYEGKILLTEILSDKEREMTPELLERSGLKFPMLKGSYQFVLKSKKPAEPEEKELFLFQLILKFEVPRNKNLQEAKYEYLVFIEHRLK